MSVEQYGIERYREELRKIEKLLPIAILVSDSAGGIKTSARYIRATQLYTRLVASLYSFVRLLPENRITLDREAFWDWGSIAAIARTVIESYHAFYYIGVEKITEDEVDFRLHVMRFHMNSEKCRLYKDWGADKNVLMEFEEGLPKDRERLRNHPCFQKVSPKRGLGLLEGKMAMHLTHVEIAERSNVLGPYFRPFYRLFSNQVHATTFAFQSQSNIRGRGFENDAERFYITLATQVVIRYLCRAILEIAEIFPIQLKGPHATALERAHELLEDSLHGP